MDRRYALIGAPSSAGSYAPGQEKAPDALRSTGLLDDMRMKGVDVVDLGDTERFRWRADKQSPTAMNVDAVARIAKAVEHLVSEAQDQARIPVILGGDCTIEVGVVSASVERSSSVGLLYIDGDADMRTPNTTTDGALDWMGLAHILGLPNTIPKLAGSCPPMLDGSSVMLFGPSNIKDDERQHIAESCIGLITDDEVKDNAVRAISTVTEWAKRFEKVLVHFDADVLDFENFPLAENTRRKQGLTFRQMMDAFAKIVRLPNLAAVTICEINPDHGEEDGSTLAEFSRTLSSCLAGQFATESHS